MRYFIDNRKSTVKNYYRLNGDTVHYRTDSRYSWTLAPAVSKSKLMIWLNNNELTEIANPFGE